MAGATNHTKICTQCGTIGTPEMVTHGSFIIELALWLCFLVPGFLYTVWRLTTRAKACTVCGATTIIPLHSPMGRKLRADLYPAKEVTHA